MKKIWFVTFVLFLVGCSPYKELKTVKYNPFKNGSKLFINVPRDYSLVKLSNEDEGYVFNYKNGIILYVGGILYTPNRKNIQHLGDSISKYRFQNNSLLKEINEMLGEKINKLWPDTLILSGIDKKGLYWKEILLTDRELCLGYKYVPKEKKENFDKALNTFRVGRKRKK